MSWQQTHAKASENVRTHYPASSCGLLVSEPGAWLSCSFLAVLVGGALVIILVGNAMRPRGPVISWRTGGLLPDTRSRLCGLRRRSRKASRLTWRMQCRQWPTRPWKMRAIYPAEIWVRDENYEGRGRFSVSITLSTLVAANKRDYADDVDA